jgi:DNA-binding transcriptional LysR family regulator
VIEAPVASLRQLHYFVTIAEEGQMTRAAKRLGIAQPALSQAMARLESALGVELLERHARGVTVTAAGEALLSRARTALLAAEDADLAARAAAEPGGDSLEWGFIGALPMAEAPELYERFLAQHPQATVNCSALPFPHGSTAAWMAAVDVVLCHSPTPHPDVGIVPLYSEPRVLVAAEGHPLAHRAGLSVHEVLGETFCGTSPALEPVRAGLWSLDDHRGGPPANTTADLALNPREMAAIVLSGRAVTAAPESNAHNVAQSVPGLVVIPLPDADPVVMSLAWRREGAGALVASLVQVAQELATG